MVGGRRGNADGPQTMSAARPPRSVRRSASSRPLGSANESSVGRWMTVLFLLALAGAYHLGLQQCNNEVKEESGVENVEEKQPWHKKIIGSIGGPTPPKQGSFTLDRLKATRKECNEIVTMLENYYFGKEQATKMLMNSWHGKWDFEAPESETDMRERANKLVDTMARALVTDGQDTFLMGGIGSSVMAGHGNCHHDSYASQMERLWSNVWGAAGMKFVFQNAGQGADCGDNHKNQHFCVKQTVSPDVDIVHYSWTYYEGGRAAPEHENLLRWIQMLPKQPPLNIFNTADLQKSSAEDKELTKYYAKYGFNTFWMSTAFFYGGHDYAAEKNREIDPFDRFSPGYRGDGYHNTTRYGELEDVQARTESLGVVMRNWHPGPMGFQITSDAFTYVYTQAIIKALDLIENDINDGNDPRDTWDASKRPLFLKGDLPEPKYCDPEYCVVDEAPGCLNYELPTFGNWGPRVENPHDELNPYQGETQKWSVWVGRRSFWRYVSKQDEAVFKNREDKEICRHLDACGGISAQKADDGMVVFRLPKMEVGLVVICGCCGKKVANDLFMNNSNIEISYNTIPLDRSTWEAWPNGKCARLLQRFPTSGRESETPTGHAYLGVKVLKDMNETVRITHVITL